MNTARTRFCLGLTPLYRVATTFWRRAGPGANPIGGAFCGQGVQYGDHVVRSLGT